MSDHHGAAPNRDALLENLAAELTLVAYRVALRHGPGGTWVDLELGLWKALADTVKKWGRELPPGSEADLACDRAESLSESVPGGVRDGFGHWRDGREAFSGE
jgi:hypothetical protein